MTVRIDRVRAMVMATARALVPTITPIWARSLYPNRNGDGPVLTAALVRGPLIAPKTHRVIDDPRELVLRFDGTIPGERVGFAATGARWYATAGIDDEATRDALLDVFTTDRGADFLTAGVEVAAVGTDGIAFDADAPGLLWGAAAIGTGVELEVEAFDEIEVAQGVATMVIELQAYAPDGGPDAAMILAEIIGGMGLDVAIAIRTDLGVGYLGAEEVVDLTTLAGALWQSRAAVRLRLSILSHSTGVAESVNEIDGSFTVRTPVVAITTDVHAELPEV